LGRGEGFSEELVGKSFSPKRDDSSVFLNNQYRTMLVPVE
jgi:hypothetical protein